MVEREEKGMTEKDYSAKLDELDELLNGPDAPIEPERVWTLLAEVSQHDQVRVDTASSGGGRT